MGDISPDVTNAKYFTAMRCEICLQFEFEKFSIALRSGSRNVRENAWIPIEEIYQSKNFSAENYKVFHSRTTKSSSFVARIFDRLPPKAIEKASNTDRRVLK